VTRWIATREDKNPHLIRISRDALGSNIQKRKVKNPEIFRNREKIK
jgi:hypothetical protein